MRIRFFYCDDSYIHWSSFYLSARHISSIIARVIYFSICSTSHFSSAIARASLHYSSRNIRKYTRLQVKSTRSLRLRSKKWFDSFVNIILFICSTIFFNNCSNIIFITVRNIWRQYTRLHVKSTRSLRFCLEDFSILFQFARHEIFYFCVLF